MKKFAPHILPPWKRLVALFSTLALGVSGLVAPVAAGAVDINTEASVLAPSSDDAVASTASLSPAVFLSHVLGQSLTKEEAAWLEQEASGYLPSELSLTYDCALPQENVTLSFSGESTVTVTASVYVGETLGTVWTPVSVTYRDQVYPLSPAENSTYEGQLPTDDESLITVTVNYEATLSPSVQSVNKLLNAAYERGQAILEAYEAYEQAVADHATATEAYNAYRAQLQQYRSDLALYNAYLAEKKDYDERLAAYQAYLAEVAIYEQKAAAYQQYLAEKAAYDEAYAEYIAFVNDPAQHEQKYLAYCAWLTDMDKVKAQLVILDSCYVSDSVGHVLYSTLKGPTVATVVSRKDELVSVGCDANDIANADRATKNLITLLTDYPQKGTEAERYTYYIRHYTEIKDNVTLLYNSLSRLYGNDAVPDILQMQGKKERYWQFVAQLYALSCALEDGIIFNVEWKISDGRLVDLLEECFILKDTNTATPMAAYPAPMDEVTAPGDMKQPTPPTAVEQPTEPLKVAQPTEPTAVTKPVVPPVVKAPGQRPVRPLFSTCEEALADAVRHQTVKAREALTQAPVFPLSLSIGKSAASDSRAVATFYHADGMTLICSLTADDEGLISLPPAPSDAPSQPGVTYTFSGWKDDGGRFYPVTDERVEITESKSFYAVYTAEKERYTITWDVDGTLTEEVYAFGETPKFKGTPEKAEDASHVYTFVGWSPVITPVSSNATYTAVFAAHEKIYEVQWVIGDTSESEEYTAGEMPVYAAVPSLPMDGRYRYVFKGWSPEITTVTGNAVYTATFEIIDLLQQNTNAVVTEQNGMITVTQPPSDRVWLMHVANVSDYAAEKNCGLIFAFGNDILSFNSEATAKLAASSAAYLILHGANTADKELCLRLYTETNELIPLDINARVSFTVPKGQIGRITDNEGQVISSLTEGTLTAALKVGAPYALQMGYGITTQITVLGQDNGTGGICHLPSDLISEGETVTFSVTAAPGYGIKTVIVRDNWGAVMPCTSLGDGQYSITMPKGAVSITADFLPLTYTVTFISDGKIVSSATYRYGETPVLPEDPTRPGTYSTSYTFAGWSPAVTAVIGDTTYEATFLAVPLGGDDATVDGGITLVELFFIGFGSFAVVFSGILVPYIVITKKKERQRHQHRH